MHSYDIHVHLQRLFHYITKNVNVCIETQWGLTHVSMAAKRWRERKEKRSIQYSMTNCLPPFCTKAMGNCCCYSILSSSRIDKYNKNKWRKHLSWLVIVFDATIYTNKNIRNYSEASTESNVKTQNTNSNIPFLHGFDSVSPKTTKTMDIYI